MSEAEVLPDIPIDWPDLVKRAKARRMALYERKPWLRDRACPHPCGQSVAPRGKVFVECGRCRMVWLPYYGWMPPKLAMAMLARKERSLPAKSAEAGLMITKVEDGLQRISV